MRIGIDIDDTICCSIENMLPYICEYYGLNYYEEKEKKLPYDAYHCLEGYYAFARLTYEKVMPNARLKTNANYYINKLKEDGHDIVIVTARSALGFHDPYGLSKNYLEKYNICYDKLIVGAKDKGEVCKCENIELFIDDNVKNCKSVENVGIKVWLFHNDFNSNDKHFDRVMNWEDV